MKNILLIGGSYGIGLALAKKLQNNNNVFVASRTNEELSNLNLTHIQFDASTDTLDTSLLPEVIDGLVYLPGSINLRPFKGLKIEAFENDLQINFISLVKVIQTVLPNLTTSNQSSIVLFSSVAQVWECLFIQVLPPQKVLLKVLQELWLLNMLQKLE